MTGGSNACVHINDPKHWRERAKEARAIADEMNDREAKQTMLGIARDYVRLAERAERGQGVCHSQSSPLPGSRTRAGLLKLSRRSLVISGAIASETETFLYR